MSVIRILQILTRPNVGGPTRHLQALLRSAPWQDRSRVQVLLAVGCCPPDEVEVELDGGGLDAVRIDALGPKVRPLRDRRALLALGELIRRFQPHVVHTHTSKAGFLGRRAALAADVPVLAHTFHGHVLMDYFRPFGSAVVRALERRQARRTQLLFAVSPSCRDELEALGVGRGRLHVLPPAVELPRQPIQEPPAEARQAARQALGVDERRALVGFVGRMVPVKRPDLFAAMARRLPGAAAVMFGDGPLLPVLRRAHEGMILFPGAVPDLWRYLPALDVLVLTSRREGCPVVALEARAFGVPVVGPDRPGIRDALGGGKQGLLLPPDSGAADLAAAVHALLADDRRRRRLVVAGLADLEPYDPARVARALITHYAGALGRSAAASLEGGSA